MLIWISKGEQVTEGHHIVEHEWVGAQFCPILHLHSPNSDQDINSSNLYGKIR